MGNMWRLSVNGVSELQEDPEYGVAWEPITARGSLPGKISHHTSAVMGASVICYGGINMSDGVTDIYEFDSNKC
jgi:hypothetical protein